MRKREGITQREIDRERERGRERERERERKREREGKRPRASERERERERASARARFQPRTHGHQHLTRTTAFSTYIHNTHTISLTQSSYTFRSPYSLFFFMDFVFPLQSMDLFVPS